MQSKNATKVLQEKGIKKRKKVAASKLAMKKKKKPNVAVNVTPKLYLSMIDPNVEKNKSVTGQYTLFDLTKL